ncbi:MAG: hypothetical protein HXX17_08205 [Geobacteraceae bacterium]|nr:hypothetical protein [Geobacteraceae bacterium]
MKLSITEFQGMAPKIASHLLPDSAAQVASNTRLTSGALRPLNSPSLASTIIVAGAKSVHSIGPSGSNAYLSWAVDTDVARSPVSDSEYRVYYTNGVAPKKTRLVDATGGAGPWPATGTEYNMGVPAPTTAMSYTLAAGGSVPTDPTLGTDWVYVYTYITQFGTSLVEESAPSPPLTVHTSPGNQTVQLAGIADPAVTLGYNYVGKRIYRTTGTAFQLVQTITAGSLAIMPTSYITVAIGTTTFSDTYADTAIAGGTLDTADWAPPMDDLKGIVAMPSGTMAAFRNNEIWFSEPGFPHAWPPKYMQALDAPIVAIKAFGNNLAVGTQAHPYVGSGVYPDSFTFTKVARLEPCVAKRSMASDESGAMYASQNGLVSIGLNGDGVATASVMTRQEFAAYNPSSILGAVFEGRYYGFYTTTTASGAFVFSAAEQTGLRALDAIASAVMVEPYSAQLYFVNPSNSSLYSVDPTDGYPLIYTWKSKLFNTPYPTNFGFIKLNGREDSAADLAAQAAIDAANAAITAANASIFASGALYDALNTYSALNEMTLNGNAMAPLLPSPAVTVATSVWSGSELRFSANLRTNQVYRLPSGFTSQGWEVQLVGQKTVTSVEMANSSEELRGS